MSDTTDRVKKIVVEHLGVEEDKVSEGASFIDDLGADSLDTVELVMAFEEEFGIEIPDDAAEKIATVKDAISFIASVIGVRMNPGAKQFTVILREPTSWAKDLENPIIPAFEAA